MNFYRVVHILFGGWFTLSKFI